MNFIYEIYIRINFIFLDSIPFSIGRLTNLRHLILDSNLFVGYTATSIRLLTALEDVGLADNALYSSLPTEIGKLSSLSMLRLNRNDLTGSIPSETLSLTNLEAMQGARFQDNQLTGSVPFCDMAGRSTSGILCLLIADCLEVDCACCTQCCWNASDNPPSKTCLCAGGDYLLGLLT